MEDKILNINDLPWNNTSGGKSKSIIDRSYLGSSSIKLFKLNSNQSFETHEHSYHQVMIFQKTKSGAVILDDEREYPITDGMVVVVRPNQCHKIINSSDEDLDILVIEYYNKNTDTTPYVDF